MTVDLRGCFADGQAYVAISRAKAVEGRAQPHLLDEVIWALYERDEDEQKEGEQELEDSTSALMYILLWTAVEALDGCWTPPKGFGEA